ncbi:squalene/phytoene synthase family protein [Candidatus Micrarchaeota archaeon]|nr:squalene/phytoene synthase family protein [Candidatus Micrarchaeota archaeon]
MKKMNLEESYVYCKDVAKKFDTNFYLGFMFLPREKRNAVFAAYAFCRYVDDIADEYKGKKDVKELIQKWEDDLDLCYDGIGYHPITIALADAVRKYKIPKAPFKGLIKGCKMDQTIKRYNNFKELLVYCDSVATTISTISLHIFGYNTKKAITYGRYLSIGLQLTNILRDVGEDAKKGRIYLPLDELEKFNYTESDLLKGVMNESFFSLMKFQVKRARDYYCKAAKLVNLINEDARLATKLMGAVYVNVLDEIERNNFDVFNNKAQLSKVHKMLLAAKMLLSPNDDFSTISKETSLQAPSLTSYKADL